MKRVANDGLQTRLHVALALEAFEREVAEVPALEGTKDDVRQVDGACDSARPRIDHHKAQVCFPIETIQILCEGFLAARCSDPGSMQVAASARCSQELFLIGSYDLANSGFHAA